MTKQPPSKPAQATKANPRLVVYGLDPDNKPRAATFANVDSELLTKAAVGTDLEMYPVRSSALKKVAASLPEGQIDPSGQPVVPCIEVALYRKLFDLLAAADAAKANLRTSTPPPVPSGLPETWDGIAPGHLVIAQESLEYGWWEAVVLDRQGETLKLRFRDYPSLPKFTRPVARIAALARPAGLGKDRARSREAFTAR